MFVDCHCHIFTERIVENINSRPAMRDALRLNSRDALTRLAPRFLAESAEANNLDVCILLPSAAPDRVRSENDRFIKMSEDFPIIRTLATLHPFMEGFSDEIQRMFEYGINGFKFSSFSQRFNPESPEVKFMLSEMERLGRDLGVMPIAVFDTFVRADRDFGAGPDHLTTPSRLAGLARQHQGMNFVGAHMGGLLADFKELRRDLLPAENLYLDTANAAHTLEENHFVELLQIHGASHILFGTDWPWFLHAPERSKIASLLELAGYDQRDQEAVFGGNAERLFKL
jgi:uncharacterized protein